MSEAAKEQTVTVENLIVRSVPNHYVEEKTKDQRDLAEWRAYLTAQIKGCPQPTFCRRLWNMQKGLCWLCGKPLNQSFISRDHLHPVSKGGKNKPNNILLAHRSCNAKRGNKGIYTREEALAHLEWLIGNKADTLRR